MHICVNRKLNLSIHIYVKPKATFSCTLTSNRKLNLFMIILTKQGLAKAKQRPHHYLLSGRQQSPMQTHTQNANSPWQGHGREKKGKGQETTKNKIRKYYLPCKAFTKKKENYAKNNHTAWPNTMHLNKNAKTHGFTLIIQRHGDNGSKFCFPLPWKDQSKDHPRFLTLKPHTNSHAKLDPNPWEK